MKAHPTVSVAALAAALLLGGCATAPHNPDDPLESYNRTMFNINQKVDDAVLKPVATGYKNVVPDPARQAVTNFFGNLGDVWSMANDFLQGDLEHGTSTLMRVGVNSTFGFLGLIDVASAMGIYKHPNDFGLTLARWGVGSGPYVVLPLFGPSTLRDTSDTALNIAYGPTTYFSPASAEYGADALRLINTRANLLGATNLLSAISLDPYTFVRSGYLQRRQSQVEAVRDMPLINLGPPNPLAPYALGGEQNVLMPIAAPAARASAASVPAPTASTPAAAAR